VSSTYLSLYVHLVFSTKNRHPWIVSPWRLTLHRYLGGTWNNLGGEIEIVEGVADHVHLLGSFKATQCLADTMRELKRSSSSWVHQEIQLSEFTWQDGYSAFSVSATSCGAVRRYIENQEQHHATTDYRAELQTMLRRANVHYDQRFFD
jgi:putative transposase